MTPSPRLRAVWLSVMSLAGMAVGASLYAAAAGRLTPPPPGGFLPSPKAAALLRGEMPLASACRAAGVPYPPPQRRVEVRKEKRLLRFYAGDRPVKEYAVALGSNPVGDKEREGDRRTPEGEYYYCYRNGSSRFHRFLGFSYPAPEDARRGRRQGMITPRQEREIVAAHRRRRCPPWNTPLGGEVGLHGGGIGSDWTWGCVALENAAIEELDAILRPGDPIHILP